MEEKLFHYGLWIITVLARRKWFLPIIWNCICQYIISGQNERNRRRFEAQLCVDNSTFFSDIMIQIGFISVFISQSVRLSLEYQRPGIAVPFHPPCKHFETCVQHTFSPHSKRSPVIKRRCEAITIIDGRKLRLPLKKTSREDVRRDKNQGNQSSQHETKKVSCKETMQ